VSLNPFHVIFVLVLGVLIFGKNLPAVAKQIGTSFLEFRKGLDEWKTMRHSAPNAGKGKSVAAREAAEEESPERFESFGTKFEPPSENG
jgi:sec-independent protein translocase protein TatA